MLYLTVFPHQTTTPAPYVFRSYGLYLTVFPHQTTTQDIRILQQLPLYLTVFPHQTTTTGAGHFDFRLLIMRQT